MLVPCWILNDWDCWCKLLGLIWFTSYFPDVLLWWKCCGLCLRNWVLLLIISFIWNWYILNLLWVSNVGSVALTISSRLNRCSASSSGFRNIYCQNMWDMKGIWHVGLCITSDSKTTGQWTTRQMTKCKKNAMFNLQFNSTVWNKGQGSSTKMSRGPVRDNF